MRNFGHRQQSTSAPDSGLSDPAPSRSDHFSALPVSSRLSFFCRSVLPLVLDLLSSTGLCCLSALATGYRGFCVDNCWWAVHLHDMKLMCPQSLVTCKKWRLSQGQHNQHVDVTTRLLCTTISCTCMVASLAHEVLTRNCGLSILVRFSVAVFCLWVCSCWFRFAMDHHFHLMTFDIEIFTSELAFGCYL